MNILSGGNEVLYNQEMLLTSEIILTILFSAAVGSCDKELVDTMTKHVPPQLEAACSFWEQELLLW